VAFRLVAGSYQEKFRNFERAGRSIVIVAGAAPGLLAEGLKTDNAQLAQVAQGFFKAALDAAAGAASVEMERDLVDVGTDFAKLPEEARDGLHVDAGGVKPDVEETGAYQCCDRLALCVCYLADSRGFLRCKTHGKDLVALSFFAAAASSHEGIPPLNP